MGKAGGHPLGIASTEIDGISKGISAEGGLIFTVRLVYSKVGV